MIPLNSALDSAERFFTVHVHPSSFLGALFYLVVFAAIAVIATAALRRSIRLVLARDAQHRLDPTMVGFMQGLAAVFIWLLALTLYAHLIPALRNMGTALLASVSVLSIVLGIAAQNTLGNLVAGMALLLYRPFRVGDRLLVAAPSGTETGTVESLSLGYTVLKTYDNRRIVLPNSGIANQVIINLSSVDATSMAIVPVSIGYSADIDRARAALLELAAMHRDALEPFSCPVVALSASSVDLSLRVWCADHGTAARVRTELLEQAKKRFDIEGIEIPYAYSNVILHAAIAPVAAHHALDASGAKTSDAHGSR